ncbi:hypothetical protein WJX84_005656 [Apatococcus fuscideae]|uniref:Dihydrolipoamide acetyltransferase component of pyruvate dehydrogenase complex n=1 Tax=Apatococcus fuscideae TaxID=2026836 RepID=A0AAW1SI79_9CHLO
MPALSSTMTEGKIVTWLKNPGDKIAKGESVVVVESDKADMDVESFNDGILGSIVTQEGGTANVGEAIAFIAESEAELEEAKAKAGSNGVALSAAKQEPAPAEAPAPAAAPAAAATATAPPAPAAAAPTAPPPSAPAATPVKRSDGRVIATPYAKKLAQQLKVDLASLAGSGPAGRITASDVEAAGNGGGHAAAPAAAAQAAIAKNMLQSLKVPEFRVSYTITTGKLDALSKKLKPKGVTMTALLAKAAGIALAKHEVVNAACTPDAQGITYNERINVAVAVSMPDGGLITPVLKDAHSTDIYHDWRGRLLIIGYFRSFVMAGGSKLFTILED